MGATENADRIRDGYRAFNSGDVAALTELFADDIVWHFPGTSKLSGEHAGRDAALGALGAYGAAGEGTLKANLVDVMAVAGSLAQPVTWAAPAITSTRLGQ